MRWTEEMAEAIVQLRAIYLSGDFDRYWYRSAIPSTSSVVRVQLITDTRLTVIERRGTELTIASDTPTSSALRFV